MAAVLGAAGAYFSLVFAAGVVLGALRVGLLEPALGPLGAVLAELPVILAVAWWAAGAAIRRFRVPARAGPRLAMGAAAFALLMAAELLLSVLTSGGAGGFAARLATPAGAAGLAGQIVFAHVPWTRLHCGL